MILNKYERWPFAIIDRNGTVWKRSTVKGWFDNLKWGSKATNSNGYYEESRYINHPDFFGCKKIMWRKDLPK